MLDGCRLLNIELPHSLEDLCRITVDVVAKCGFSEDVYARPLAYKSSEVLGVRLHDLELLTQDRKRVKFKSDVIGDKLVAMTFIYTSCTTICPVYNTICFSGYLVSKQNPDIETDSDQHPDSCQTYKQGRMFQPR